MRMWGAGFGFAAVRAVTRDKKPVSIPFLKWNGIPSAMRRSHDASVRRDRFAASWWRVEALRCEGIAAHFLARGVV